MQDKPSFARFLTLHTKKESKIRPPPIIYISDNGAADNYGQHVTHRNTGLLYNTTTSIFLALQLSMTQTVTSYNTGRAGAAGTPSICSRKMTDSNLRRSRRYRGFPRSLKTNAGAYFD